MFFNEVSTSKATAFDGHWSSTLLENLSQHFRIKAIHRVGNGRLVALRRTLQQDGALLVNQEAGLVGSGLVTTCGSDLAKQVKDVVVRLVEWLVAVVVTATFASKTTRFFQIALRVLLQVVGNLESTFYDFVITFFAK